MNIPKTPTKSNTNKLLEKAAQQVLGESLGFDEGRAYYLILIKKNKDIEKEFSYSKKYRLLKNLFTLGAIGKIKPHNKEFFSYLPLPPSFLKAKEINAPKSVILFLEELYAENHRDFIENTKFSQIILKDLNGFVLFLLKYIMKEKASILGTDLNANHLEKHFEDEDTKDKIGKITLNTSGLETRHLGIIDDRIGFELLRIKGKISDDFIGYIASRDPKNAKNTQETNPYVDGIQEKFA